MPFKDHDLSETLHDLRKMEGEVERLLKDFFISKNPMLMLSENGWTPNIDVYETKSSFIIKMELAGVQKESIKVQLAGRMIRISGYREDECAEQREHFHLMEISYGNFVRKLELPDDLDGDNVQASYERGILKIVVPKATEVSKELVIVPIED